MPCTQLLYIVPRVSGIGPNSWKPTTGRYPSGVAEKKTSSGANAGVATEVVEIETVTIPRGWRMGQCGDSPQSPVHVTRRYGGGNELRYSLARKRSGMHCTRLRTILQTGMPVPLKIAFALFGKMFF